MKNEVSWVCAYIFLIVFEGALRKWIFPELSSYIYFIKDPIAFYLIFRGLFFKPVRTDFLKLYLVLSLVFFAYLIYGVLQLFYVESNVIVFLIGMRAYFLWPFLAIAIANLIDIEGARKVAKFSCYLAIPSILIVIVQYFSPVNSYINKSISDDAFIFQVVDGVVRTTGFFTFSLPQSFFVGYIFLCLLFIGSGLSKNRINNKWYAAIFFGNIISLFLSGSRSAYIISAVVIFFPFFMRPGLVLSSRRTLLIILAMFFLATSAVLIFDGALTNIIERNNSAISDEGGVFDRLLRMIISYSSYMMSTPISGYGIGVGTNAGSMLLTGESQFTLVEDELSRIILEGGPIIGFIYIALRLYVVFISFSLAARFYSKEKVVGVFAFVGFSLCTMLSAPITTQGSVGAISWLAYALLLSTSYRKPEKS